MNELSMAYPVLVCLRAVLIRYVTALQRRARSDFTNAVLVSCILTERMTYILKSKQQKSGFKGIIEATFRMQVKTKRTCGLGDLCDKKQLMWPLMRTVLAQREASHSTFHSQQISTQSETLWWSAGLKLILKALLLLVCLRHV